MSDQDAIEAVTLPLAALDVPYMAAALARWREACAREPTASGLTVLTMLLQAHGLSVVAAADGRRGLEAFRAHAPKLVLTDILMPEQDGIGAILQMRRERPDAKIVAMSGGGRVGKTDYLTAAEKLGAAAAVEKMDMEKLVEILLRLLKA